MKFKIDDKVKVVDVPDFVLESFPDYKQTIGKTGIINDIAKSDPSLPYRIKFNGQEYGFVEGELSFCSKLDKALE